MLIVRAQKAAVKMDMARTDGEYNGLRVEYSDNNNDNECNDYEYQ